MKFCKDCKHLVRNTAFPDDPVGAVEHGNCDVEASDYINPASGRHATNLPRAVVARASGHPCGPDALLFEPTP